MSLLHRPLIWIASVLSIIGFAVGVMRWNDAATREAPTLRLGTSVAETKRMSGRPDQCATAPTMAMAVVALDAGGVGRAGQIAGRHVKPLLIGRDRAQPAAGSTPLVAINAPSDLPGAQQVANDVTAKGGVGRAGVVLPQSSDPALRSCDYDLADSPGAATLAVVAGGAMVDAGFVDSDALSAPWHTWNVTDDPLDPAIAIVTLGVRGKPDVQPAIKAIGGPPIQAFTTVWISALVNRHSKTVLAVGYAPWTDLSNVVAR